MKVVSNRGSGEVDIVSLKEFGQNYKNYLYKLWNQMSSGSYMPPAVRLIEIPKKDGGVRPLSIPRVSDCIGQKIVKELLEGVLDLIFHDDSYDYPPGISAIDAIGMARKRCCENDWVIDLDIKGFFNNIPHVQLMKAVRKHCKCRWMLLYIERWLVAPLQKEDAKIASRNKGVPQDSVIGSLLTNLYLYYSIDECLRINHADCKFERYADDAIIHCKSETQALKVKEELNRRMNECGLELHLVKTKMMYCKNSNRRGTFENISFDFLRYTFKPIMAKNSIRGVWFTNWLPAVSNKAMKSMNEKMKGRHILLLSGHFSRSNQGNKSCHTEMDKLLWTILQIKTDQFYAYNQCETCRLGKTEVQTASAKRNESNKMVTWHKPTRTYFICTLEALREPTFR